MLKLVSRITFYNGDSSDIKTTFTFVNNVSIVSSWANLTDTCLITIPRKIEYRDKDITATADAVFKRGDKVKVELGYDNNYKTRFLGYITNVDIKFPIRITCEDSMFLLKKKKLNKTTYVSVKLSELIKNIVGTNYEITADQNLGQFIIQDGVSTVEVLNYLREKYNIYSYYKLNSSGSPILYAGFAYVPALRKNHIFDTNKNIINNDLTYKKDGDFNIKIKMVGQQTVEIGGKQKNKKTIVWYPSELAEGSTKTFTTNTTTDSDDLSKMAKAEFDKFSIAGYSGTFYTFGAPAVSHGDGVSVRNPEMPELDDDVYLIKEVETTFGIGGYRQKITLDGLIKN